MISCDVLRVGTVGLMAVPGMPFTALCVLLFFTVLTGTPFSSARTAPLPDILPGDRFVLLRRVAAPSARIGMMGWLAVLSCASLIGSEWSPPL